MFDKYKVNATFFTIGYIAEKPPELVEEIVSKGHGIACHECSHPNVKRMNAKEFKGSKKVSGGIGKNIRRKSPWNLEPPYCSINKQNLGPFML